MLRAAVAALQRGALREFELCVQNRTHSMASLQVLQDAMADIVQLNARVSALEAGVAERDARIATLEASLSNVVEQK